MQQPALKISWRKLGARSVAAMAVLMAASWGPLTHSLRVAVSVGPDETSTCRLVLTTACGQAANSNTIKKAVPQPGSKKSDAPVERLLSAVPDILESAASFHFDLDQAPAAIDAINLRIVSASTQNPDANPVIKSDSALPHLARGPPHTL